MDPFTITLIITAISALAQTYQAYQQKQQAKATAKDLQEAADERRRHAANIEKQAEQEKLQLRLKALQAQGASTTSSAASGVLVGSGTSADKEADIASAFDLDMKNLNYDIQMRAWEHRREAANLYAESRDYKKAGSGREFAKTTAYIWGKAAASALVAYGVGAVFDKLAQAKDIADAAKATADMAEAAEKAASAAKTTTEMTELGAQAAQAADAADKAKKLNDAVTAGKAITQAGVSVGTDYAASAVAPKIEIGNSASANNANSIAPTTTTGGTSKQSTIQRLAGVFKDAKWDSSTWSREAASASFQAYAITEGLLSSARPRSRYEQLQSRRRY